jgi:hypothetical protein
LLEYAWRSVIRGGLRKSGLISGYTLTYEKHMALVVRNFFCHWFITPYQPLNKVAIKHPNR